MPFRRVATFLALVALAAGMSGEVGSALDRFGGGSTRTRPPTTAASTTTAPPTTTTTLPPQPVSWTLFGAGDVLMDRSEAAARDPFTQLVPRLADADLALVNVETAVAGTGAPEAGKEFTFRSPPSAARTMATAGVDAGNLGNNHALDYGPGALLDTVRHLRRAGMAPVGAGRDATAALAPATFEVGGVSVAVIGASDVLPAGWPAGDGTPGVASARDGRLLEAVRAARAGHDVVVVMVHWGVELAPCPSEQQVALADALVSAGATVVLGSHPHVLQPVVERGGGLVAFSLGNFVWHSRTGPQADTGILEVRFDGARLDGFTFHPHRLDGSGDPVPADAATNARIEAAVADHCGVGGGVEDAVSGGASSAS